MGREHDAGLKVGLLVLGGAGPREDLVASLGADAINVVQVSLSAAPASDVAVILVWVAADATPAALERAVAFRARHLPSCLLLGCAPEGEALLGERALAAGFDDFVAGRGSARELSARIRSLARHLPLPVAARHGAALVHGRLSLAPDAYELRIGDRAVTLTARERHAMRLLLEHAGGAVPRVALLDAVWGEDDLEVGLRSVDNLIHRLRRKVGVGAIVSVRGVGFRLADA